MKDRAGAVTPAESEKVMKKIVKIFLDWVVALFTGKGEVGHKAVDDGLIDLSGQGRDKYGK